MRFTKIRLTKDASNRLRFLAGRTGLTPNLLCRMGFCLSLEETKIPNPSEFAEEEREFNRYTLLGEYDVLYIALLRQRLHQDGLGTGRSRRILPRSFESRHFLIAAAGSQCCGHRKSSPK